MSPLFSYEAEAVLQGPIIQGFLEGHRGYHLIIAPKFATSPFANHASLPPKHFYCSDCEVPWNRCDPLGCAGLAAPAWRWPGQGLWLAVLQLLWSLSFFLGVEVSTKSVTLKKRPIAVTMQSLFFLGLGRGVVAALFCRGAWLCFANNLRSSHARWGPPHCLKSSAAPTLSGTGLNSYCWLRFVGYCTRETPWDGADTQEWQQSSGSFASPACWCPIRRCCPATEENTWRGSPGKESTVRVAASCFRKCSRKNLGDRVRKTTSVCIIVYVAFNELLLFSCITL